MSNTCTHEFASVRYMIISNRLSKKIHDYLKLVESLYQICHQNM